MSRYDGSPEQATLSQPPGTPSRRGLVAVQTPSSQPPPARGGGDARPLVERTPSPLCGGGLGRGVNTYGGYCPRPGLADRNDARMTAFTFLS